MWKQEFEDSLLGPSLKKLSDVLRYFKKEDQVNTSTAYRPGLQNWLGPSACSAWSKRMAASTYVYRQSDIILISESSLAVEKVSFVSLASLLCVSLRNYQ